MASVAKMFQERHKLTNAEYDKLLEVALRIQVRIDAFWEAYRAPMRSLIVHGYWRAFPANLHREDVFRFLASLGYYKIIASPATGREYVFSRKCRDEAELIESILQFESQKKRKPRGINDKAAIN